MLAGDFQQKLRKLNPRLKIFCGDSNNTPASIFYVSQGEFEPICGIDKNSVPEHEIRNEDGTLFKGGWRRAIRILIQRGFVDRYKAEKIFGTHFSVRPVSKLKTLNAEEAIQKFKNKYGGF